jgi:xanthine dehydrogenase accessory factor
MNARPLNALPQILQARAEPRPEPRAEARPAPAAGGSWLTPLPGHWIDAAIAQLSRHPALVRVTVITVRGSAPREPGATLLVGPDGALGTIGGGRLEWHATSLARRQLSAADGAGAAVRVADLVLGPELGQCCGGRVQLWLERLTHADLPWLRRTARRLRNGDDLGWVTDAVHGGVTRRLMPAEKNSGAVQLQRRDGRLTLIERPCARRPALWIFGAGHVGQALTRLLGELGLFDITWVDSRAELLPGALPDGIRVRHCAAPASLVAAAPAGARFVVLTHDHALDYDICRGVLERGDACWLGLIGSGSKAARFRSRLVRDGVDPDRLPGLNCPIGVPGIASKLPAAIAIAIAAALLQQHDASPPGDQAGLPQAGPRAAGPPQAAPAHPKDLDCGGRCQGCGAPRGTVP